MAMERIGPHGLEIVWVRRDGRRRYDPANTTVAYDVAFFDDRAPRQTGVVGVIGTTPI